jgi:hypothetical protein
VLAGCLIRRICVTVAEPDRTVSLAIAMTDALEGGYHSPQQGKSASGPQEWCFREERLA